MSESPKPELRAEIQRVGQRYVSHITTETGELILRHEFQHDPTGLTYLGPPWAIDRSRLEPSELRQLGPRPTRYWSRAQAAAHGWQLFRYLFGNGRALASYRKEHPAYASCPLTLTLSPETSTLWRQPWEYLYDGKDFVCLTGRMPVIRRPPGLRTLTPRISDPPLRVLALVAAPLDQPRVDTEREIAYLHRALNNVIARGILELDILAEPTVVTLRNTLQERHYQVVHYIGHACVSPDSPLGQLCLENQLAQTEMVTGQYLARTLKGWIPTIAIMDACQSARFGVLEALTGIAQDMLSGGLPSAITTPIQLPHEALTIFYAALYEALAKGLPLRDSMQRGRSALAMGIESEHSGHLVWGVPMLYHRAVNQPVVYRSETSSSTSTAKTVTVPQELASSAVVGWRTQFLTARRALAENGRILYIWGPAGVGKRAFLSQLERDLSPKPLANLHIRCSDTLDPLIVLGKIAAFWRESVPDETGREAAALLLDASQDPFRRAQQAQQLLASKRLLIALEALFQDQAHDVVPGTQDILEQILLGLMSASSKTIFVCTASRPWPALGDLTGRAEYEIYLPLLDLQPAIHIMNHLQHLRRVSLKDKETLFHIVGGHAESLILLNGWVALGLALDQFLKSPPSVEPSPAAWTEYLSAQLLDSLDPGELQMLHMISILRRPFDTGDLIGLTPLAPSQADRMLEHWHQIGLVEPAGHSTRFLVRPAVRMAVLDRLSELDLQDLHRKAGEYYGTPFLEEAHRQLVNRNLTHWSKEDIGLLARDAHGILGSQLRAERDGTPFERLLERVLAWHYHLVAAEEIEAAKQIARTLAPELNRRGLQDLARRFFAQASGFSAEDKTQAMLDQLQTEEQSLAAALQVYEETQRFLDAEHLEIQRAYVLLRAGDAQHRLGNLQAAIERYQTALKLMRQVDDQEGAAQCLRRLATLHREMGNLQEALVATQAAKEQYEALSSFYGLAAVEQDRGYILSELGHPEKAIECFTASLRLCRRLADEERVAENLRQIGTLLSSMGRLDIGIQVLKEALKHYIHLNSPEQVEVQAQIERLQNRRARLARALQRLRENRQARV